MTNARKRTPRRRWNWVAGAALATTLAATLVAPLDGARAADPSSPSGPSDPTGPGSAPTEPGPEDSQGTAYVAPTAPPATDIGVRRARTLAPGTYTCTGYGSIHNQTSPAEVNQDIFEWGEFAPFRVGDGTGNVNWRLNPYTNASWYMWLHSLRWLGQGITAGEEGDLDTLTHTAAIVRDWVRDNPYSWKVDIGAWEATMHRTNVLICLRQAVLTAYDTATLPTEYQWLDASLRDHAKFLINNWSGAWNHGTDESIALFGVGCLLDDASYRDLAVQRLGAGITTSIDAQGATNEQSTAYARFNYDLWGRAEEALRACNVDPGTTIGSRRALLATFLAHATDSLGNFHQIGDSQVTAAPSRPDTPLEYVASKGESGTPPADRVAIYNRGYVFGRSSWGDSTTPFGLTSTYSIRFGDARTLHGHYDHTALTWTARGRDILIDSGHAGYQTNIWRTFVRTPDAHNVLATPQSRTLSRTTALNRKLVESNWAFYEFSGAPAVSVKRTRGVLIMNDPDVLVTLDRATSTKSQQFQTNWHLPSDQNARIYSRTTAIAEAPGDSTRTILFQIPYKQALPRGALLVRKGMTRPVQGWHFPDIWTRNAAPSVLMARSGRSASILSFIVPVDAGAGVQYRVRASGRNTIVDLTIKGRVTSILISPGGGLVRLN